MSVGRGKTSSATASGATPTLADSELATLEGPRAPRRGDTIGRYVLLERLGEGGMGLVYAAYDPDLDRRVAIKILRGPTSILDEDSHARLLREAQAMARLSHPNVMTVHEVGTADGRPFIAMELVAGRDLRTWFREASRPWTEVVEVMLGAGRGLAAAHRAGLIHRDFKPANVLVADDGLVRVLDFGLARQVALSTEVHPEDEALLRSGGAQLDSKLETPVTRTGTVPGTPAYMAPEQHLRGELDEQTDQFAFCVTAYEGLFGRRPFEGGSRAALMMATTQGRIVPPPRASPVPRRLVRAVLRGLQPDPNDRFESMNALLQELETAARPRRRSMPRLGLGIGLLGGTVWWAVGEVSDDPCPPPTAALAEVWSPEDRSALRTVFSQTRLPYAERSAAAITDRLDRYGRDWIEASVGTCRAARVEQRQSATMHELVVRCLERRRHDLKHVVDVVVDADPSSNETLVENAAKISNALGSLETCAPETLADNLLPSPPDPEAVEAIHADLSRVRALWAAARYTEGLEVARLAVARARDANHPPILAEALLELGTTQVQAGTRNEGTTTLQDAAVEATRAGHVEAQFEAWLELVRAESVSNAHPEQALIWASYAWALIDRLDLRPIVRAELLEAEAQALWQAGRESESLDKQERALALLDQHAAHPIDRAAAKTQLGNTYVMLGRLEEAHASLEAARTLAVSVYGEAHPTVGTIDNSLGAVAYRRGDLQSAADHFTRAHDNQSRILGPDHPDLMFSLGNLGNVHRERGELEAALDAMNRVWAIVQAHYPPVHRDSGMTLHNLAEIWAQKGRCDEAIGRYRRALAIRRDVHGEDHPFVANTLTGLGECLLESGEATEALRSLREAWSIREARDMDPVETARTAFLLVRARRATGADPPSLADASARLERALEKVEVGNARGAALRARITAWRAAARP